MEKIIYDSERSLLPPQLNNDYFKVVVTYNDGSSVHSVHYAVLTSEVSAFMDSIYDSFDYDAVIQFNGIFSSKDSRFWFTMV